MNRKDSAWGNSMLNSSSNLSALKAGNVSRTSAVHITAGKQGAALVEFAIILPVVLIVLLGIIDLGRVFYTYEALSNAAREGARRCALYPPCDDGWALTQVHDELDGRIAVTGATVAYPSGNGRVGGDPVRITVTSSFSFVTPLIDDLVGGGAANVVDSPLVLHVAAEMPIW